MAMPAPRAAAPPGAAPGAAAPGRVFSPRLGGMLRNAGPAGQPAAGLLLAADCLSCIDLGFALGSQSRLGIVREFGTSDCLVSQVD